MKPLLQKVGKRTDTQMAQSAVPRLTLAAFGKHPGWDDHMPGIGMETETLAYVKQTLYVGGIGRQIDSGAWEKLEPNKRQEGFGHTFLWLRSGHTVLGQIWSSKDGKGRSKYPMILAIDGESVTAEFMLTSLRGGLENLREACKSAATAEQVATHCRAAQEQLRLVPGGNAGAPADAPAQPAARQFLERPELGPGRTGLLRVLHELAGAFDLSGQPRPTVRAGARGPRSLHLRVPFASDSEDQALVLWSSFLAAAVGPCEPLLLIARAGTEWVDVMVGEPTSDDFFCLQASLKGLPLATQIPYELTAESRQSLPGLETRFLGKAPAAVETPPPIPPRDQPPPLPSAPTLAKSAAPAAPSAKGKRALVIGVAAGLFGVLIYLLLHNAQQHLDPVIPKK
jgi:hypothetical protein